jgi:dihydrofolate synthase / folylpolyglutamate synthase
MNNFSHFNLKDGLLYLCPPMHQFESYQQAVDYLYSNLPMFQRVGAVAFKKDLANTLALCDFLGNPQQAFRSIHIAGTNGKGSTSHMLASILQEAGYRTGLYTSPHLKDYTERIRINGIPVTQEFIIDFLNRTHTIIESVKPSFFEITVAIAFDYFARYKVDVAVIETGLGGRLDSTNVINPMLSVITNIGWDHMDLLGDTLEKIAVEKAGIIKFNTPVVISEKQNDVEKVFLTRASAENAIIHFATDKYKVELNQKNAFTGWKAYHKGSLFLELDHYPLGGLYQQKNIAGVLMAVDVLQHRGLPISSQALKAGLEKVVSNTHLKGRWQQLGDKPLIVCDTGHNKDGIEQVVAQLRTINYQKLHIVIGMVKEKDAASVLSLLPTDAHYYFCQASIPRAERAEVLAEKAHAVGLRGTVIPDVNDAIREAKRNARPEDMIFIGGSTFVVAEIDDL